MCSSRKYPYPPHGRSMEIPRACGVLKAKILKEMYGVKMEFPGRGVGDLNQKTFRGRGMDIFWNNTILYNYMLLSQHRKQNENLTMFYHTHGPVLSWSVLFLWTVYLHVLFLSGIQVLEDNNSSSFNYIHQ